MEKETRFEQIEEYEFPKIEIKRKSQYKPVIIGSGP